MSFDVAYSLMLSEKFSLAAGVRFLMSDMQYSSTEERSASNAFAADLACYYNDYINIGSRECQLGIGLNISNIGSKITFGGSDYSEFIPTNMRLGAALMVPIDEFNRFTISATQRPTTRIITGNIKANFPGRMAFRVASQIDSRTILDRTGADQLVGRGDMLFLGGGEPVRVQCAFIDTPEIEAVNDFIAAEPGPVDAMELPEPDDPNAVGAGGGIEGEAKNLDPYFDDAAHAIVISQQGSTSMIQRRFSIGYNRAGRLMDQLEKAGIVGAAQGSKPREVLLQDESSLNVLLARIHDA